MLISYFSSIFNTIFNNTAQQQPDTLSKVLTNLSQRPGKSIDDIFEVFYEVYHEELGKSQSNANNLLNNSFVKVISEKSDDYFHKYSVIKLTIGKNLHEQQDRLIKLDSEVFSGQDYLNKIGDSNLYNFNRAKLSKPLPKFISIKPVLQFGATCKIVSNTQINKMFNPNALPVHKNHSDRYTSHGLTKMRRIDDKNIVYKQSVMSVDVVFEKKNGITKLNTFYFLVRYPTNATSEREIAKKTQILHDYWTEKPKNEEEILNSINEKKGSYMSYNGEILDYRYISLLKQIDMQNTSLHNISSQKIVTCIRVSSYDNYKKYILNALAQNKGIEIYFSVNTRGRAKSEPFIESNPDQLYEHTAQITGYDTENDKFRITHWGNNYWESAKDLYISSSQLAKTRDMEYYRYNHKRPSEGQWKTKQQLYKHEEGESIITTARPKKNTGFRNIIYITDYN